MNISISHTCLTRMSALVAAALVAAPASASIVNDSPNGFALRSGETIGLGGNTQVTGSVGAMSTINTGWGAFVDGSVESNGDQYWNAPTIGSWTSGGEGVRLGWSETRALAAGSYGAFQGDSSVTLQLGAGTYAFDSFDLGWGGRVVADTSQGDVYILVTGGLNAADETRFTANGDGMIYLVTGGNASFGYKADLEAAVYSKGSLNFGNQATLTGLAYSDRGMTTGYGSQFAYFVPGPASIALLPLAAGVARGGRRRRR